MGGRNTSRNKPALIALAVAALTIAMPAAPAAASTSAPTSLTATSRNSRYIALSWHRSAGDDGSYRYRVSRDGIAIGSRQSTTTYLDRPALGRHVYEVRAINSAGIQSALSTAVTAHAVSKLPGSVAPGKPINLAGTTGGNGRARLTWAFGSTGTSATHSYRIFRNGMAVGTVPYTSTSFDDYRAGLRAATYDYTVQAVDANGYTSAMAGPVHVTVQPSQFPWAGTLYFSGSTASNAVALTFDDCYNGAVIAREASILRANNAPATFFCTGQGMVENVNVIANIARDFPVGNHTWDHQNLNNLTDSGVFNELITATKKIEAVTGRPMPPIMRPPYGSADAGVRADCGQLGFAVVRWNIETNDWRSTQSSSEVLAAALEAKAGNIVIMHDRSKTADVLAKIISGLRAKGLRLVTVPQLLGIPWQPAEKDYN